MKAFGLVIGTALALAGCATGSVWDKPGGTQQSFAADKYNCMKRRLPPFSEPRSGAVRGVYGSLGVAEALAERTFADLDPEGTKSMRPGREPSLICPPEARSQGPGRGIFTPAATIEMLH